MIVEYVNGEATLPPFPKLGRRIAIGAPPRAGLEGLPLPVAAPLPPKAPPPPKPAPPPPRHTCPDCGVPISGYGRRCRRCAHPKGVRSAPRPVPAEDEPSPVQSGLPPALDGRVRQLQRLYAERATVRAAIAATEAAIGALAADALLTGERALSALR